jgi:hypothetical protein
LNKPYSLSFKPRSTGGLPIRALIAFVAGAAIIVGAFLLPGLVFV